MTQEEKILIEKFGKEQPFRVPEGYFDTFARQLMERLTEQAVPTSGQSEHGAQVVAMRSRRYWHVAARWLAAACFCGVLVGAGWSWLATSDSAATAPTAAVQSSSSFYTSDIDQMADYAMMDVSDMYAYVSDY